MDALDAATHSETADASAGPSGGLAGAGFMHCEFVLLLVTLSDPAVACHVPPGWVSAYVPLCRHAVRRLWLGHVPALVAALHTLQAGEAAQGLVSELWSTVALQLQAPTTSTTAIAPSSAPSSATSSSASDSSSDRSAASTSVPGVTALDAVPAPSAMPDVTEELSAAGPGSTATNTSCKSLADHAAAVHALVTAPHASPHKSHFWSTVTTEAAWALQVRARVASGSCIGSMYFVMPWHHISNTYGIHI